MRGSDYGQEPVIVVGAGWSGIAAALRLAQNNEKVILLEAAPQAGGRARSIAFGEDQVDNGQHLLIGAYSETLNLLKLLNISIENVVARLPFKLTFVGEKEKNYELSLPNFPAPLNLLFGILFSKGLRKKEKWQLIKFCYRIQKLNFLLEEDLSVNDFLLNQKIDHSLVRKFFSPLVQAALSTPIEFASAQVFLNVLKDSFTGSRRNSDFLFPKIDLSQFLPEPAMHFLKEREVEIWMNRRVEDILIKDNTIIGVETRTGRVNGKAVILACSLESTKKLLKRQGDKGERILEQPLKTLEQFRFESITTIYFRYARSLNLPYPMLGLMEQGLFLFDRGFVGQPAVLSVVGSQNMPLKTIEEKISALYPDWGKPLETRTITEKFAAFSCVPGIEAWRPSAETPVSGLYLAGDYAQADYPACLEGALRSGIAAANLVSSCLSSKL